MSSRAGRRFAAVGLAALWAAMGSAQDDGLRVFISADMEGLSGIAHSEMTSASGAEYGRGRDLMMSDVNAAIQGALNAGATDTEFVSVKRAIRRTTAELIHPQETARMIREAAVRALESIPEPLPAPGPPVAIEIQYTRPDLAEIASLLPQIERIAPDTVRFEAGDMAEGYAIIRVLYRNLSE